MCPQSHPHTPPHSRSLPPLPPPPRQVTGFYELLQEFSIQAPAEDLAAAACVDADYAALRDTAWAAEAAKERHAEEFRCVPHWTVLVAEGCIIVGCSCCSWRGLPDDLRGWKPCVH
jgi:hypothetical protein